MPKEKPPVYIEVKPEPMVSYEVPLVSSTKWKQIVYEKGVDGKWLPIKGGAKSSTHAIYRISLAITNTNRAAMSEYLLVMRPDPTPGTRDRAYQYLERTAVVHNQVGSEDINTPILFFDDADNILKVKLAGMPDGQTVLVYITRILNRTVVQLTENDLRLGRNLDLQCPV